jgi:hypothetical protein
MTSPVATVPAILRAGIHSARPAATDVAGGTLYSCSTHNLIYQSDGATWTTWAISGLLNSVVTLEYIIDGAGSAPTTGDKGAVELGFSGVITAARLLANASGSGVVDIKKATYSGLPSFSSICASAKPTLSSAQKSQDSTLTGWTTAVSAGDWLLFHVDSASGFTLVTVSLTITRTT